MHSKTSSPPLFLTCVCFLMFGTLEQLVMSFWTWWRFLAIRYHIGISLSADEFSRCTPSANNRQGFWSGWDGQLSRDTTVCIEVLFTSWWILTPYALYSVHAAPDFTIDAWPAHVMVQSKHNTPIEGFWRWKWSGEGHSIYQEILIGKASGIYNCTSPIHT